jgi:hypothetical protein
MVVGEQEDELGAEFTRYMFTRAMGKQGWSLEDIRAKSNHSVNGLQSVKANLVVWQCAEDELG